MSGSGKLKGNGSGCTAAARHLRASWYRNGVIDIIITSENWLILRLALRRHRRNRTELIRPIRLVR